MTSIATRKIETDVMNSVCHARAPMTTSSTVAIDAEPSFPMAGDRTPGPVRTGTRRGAVGRSPPWPNGGAARW